MSESEAGQERGWARAALSGLTPFPLCSVAKWLSAVPFRLFIENLQIIGIFKRQVVLGWPNVMGAVMAPLGFLHFQFVQGTVRA